MPHNLGSVESINNWFTTAKPNPTTQDEVCQLGVHIEEGNEFVDALLRESEDWRITRLADVYKQSSQSEAEDYVTEIDHVEMLDALCDQIVTAIGSANFLGYNILGALAEVDESNWSKFENGKPVHKPNTTKIGKGIHYKAPELAQYLGDKYGN